MKTISHVIVAAMAVALLSVSAEAQICPTPMPYPQPQPAPQPVPAAYFLGVYTSTTAVSGAAPAAGEPQAYVVPGYEQSVYGQRVNRIVPNSPAFAAGLEPGDILVNANGYPLDSQEILRAVIASSEGYMEIQVLDGRSGQLVWVVAETDPQGEPMAIAPVAPVPAPGPQPQPSVEVGPINGTTLNGWKISGPRRRSPIQDMIRKFPPTRISYHR